MLLKCLEKFKKKTWNNKDHANKKQINWKKSQVFGNE